MLYDRLFKVTKHRKYIISVIFLFISYHRLQACMNDLVLGHDEKSLRTTVLD